MSSRSAHFLSTTMEQRPIVFRGLTRPWLLEHYFPSNLLLRLAQLEQEVHRSSGTSSPFALLVQFPQKPKHVSISDAFLYTYPVEEMQSATVVLNHSLTRARVD